MGLSFRKAPLVEIIAELRWQPSYPSLPIPQQLGAQPAPLLFLGTNQLENFLHRFGSEVYSRGFQRTERLIPGGIPFWQGQAVSRFKATAPETNILYQIGVGLFSANGTPPYRSFETFAPVVENGVDALLKSREEKEQSTPFNPVSLRYIDAFGPDLTGGRDATSFLADVLGIHISLPEATGKYALPGKPPKPFLMFAIPVTNGTLQINTGEAVVAGRTVVLLDMTFATQTPVSPSKVAIMESLNQAHSVIHDVFMNMSEPVRSLMEPEQ